LEIATGSDEEIEQSPPPIPPRTSSSFVCHFIDQRPLPISPTDTNNSRQLSTNTTSEPSDSTSTDVSDLIEDTSEDTSDSDDTAEDKQYISNEFDANSTLPPIPNGTLDLTSPDKQRFSSDEER
jgi:hypothetical protein